jgi:hypothetical protein
MSIACYNDIELENKKFQGKRVFFYIRYRMQLIPYLLYHILDCLNDYINIKINHASDFDVKSY